jgi:hypothetical protein
MLAQIAHQDKDFDQLICDGKTLRGSAAQPDGTDGATGFVTQVTLYTRELGVDVTPFAGFRCGGRGTDGGLQVQPSADPVDARSVISTGYHDEHMHAVALLQSRQALPGGISWLAGKNASTRDALL